MIEFSAFLYIILNSVINISGKIFDDTNPNCSFGAFRDLS
jgi:hypothetical protein